MKKAEIKFNIVTPCILAGANQKEAELRAPSIRGQLRYWFRVLGGSLGDESRVFGGIGQGDEGRASSVVVRVKTPQNTIKRLSAQRMEDINTAEKFDYLLWPLRRPEDARGVIEENQTVEIQILQRQITTGLPLDVNVIKVFLLLGALGTRSRRAYGSIYPESVKFDGVEWKIPRTVEELRNELAELLSGVNCKILQLKSHSSIKDAIQSCAAALKRFRCGSSKHGASASKWGKSDHDLRFPSGGDEIYRVAIALPHSTKYYEASVNDYERLASPVIFKVVTLEGKFIPIVIFLRDYFLKENIDVGLSIDKGKTIKKTVKLSHDLLNEMMNEHSTYWGGAEVLYS